MTSRKHTAPAISLHLVMQGQFKAWLKKQPAATVEWLEANQITGEKSAHCLLPPQSKGRGNSGVLAIAEEPLGIWSIAGLPDLLAPGTYALHGSFAPEAARELYLGWLLGSYRFTRYKKKDTRTLPTLLPPAGIDARQVEKTAEILCASRDLINTPANDLGPEELAAACREVARRYKAKYAEIEGEALMKANFPAVYEVGKASTRPPRLCDFVWGNARHPKVTLVGKGVCFDTGGLDIKPSSGMKLMKKDMGGAASVLALAQLIMEAKLPVRLRVLIPAVENSIAGNAFRPSDIIATRKGLTVEVGNTDAEGRLILCDALYEADQEKPDLLIDCATLTGAARTALGPDLPALFTPSDTLADALHLHSRKVNDPLWRLPLWEHYRKMLKSPVADLNSAPDSPFAGAITAALYLKEFVTNTLDWAHIDMMAWNPTQRPGRPAGAEITTVRALFSYISERFNRA